VFGVFILQVAPITFRHANNLLMINRHHVPRRRYVARFADIAASDMRRTFAGNSDIFTAVARHAGGCCRGVIKFGRPTQWRKTVTL